jgi:CBS domain containing-hemolysin-like protein
MKIALSLFLLIALVIAGFIAGFISAVHPAFEKFRQSIKWILNFVTPGSEFRLRGYADESELREMVDEANERGLVEDSQREMIQSVFDLGETLVRELMVPRIDMVWIEGDKTLRQGLSLALRSGFTRIPVISENLDNVIGTAYVKDLARRVHEHHESEQSEDVKSHSRPATFVPESKTAAELLKEMQRDQIHMAIVVDEYGGTAGLITIEDILEEIVGEIADEYDQEVPEVERIDGSAIRFSARIHIEDFEEACDISLTDTQKEDVDSLGGLMAKILGGVPIAGSSVTIEGWKLKAERPAGRRHRISFIVATRATEEMEVRAPQ